MIFISITIYLCNIFLTLGGIKPVRKHNRGEKNCIYVQTIAIMFYYSQFSNYFSSTIHSGFSPSLSLVRRCSHSPPETISMTDTSLEVDIEETRSWRLFWSFLIKDSGGNKLCQGHKWCFHDCYQFFQRSYLWGWWLNFWSYWCLTALQKIHTLLHISHLLWLF